MRRAWRRNSWALKPSGAVKFFYSIGQVVESGYIAVNGFVFFYYSAVLGLSGTLIGAAPQTIRTPSLRIRISPKVASTWSRWSRP